MAQSFITVIGNVATKPERVTTKQGYEPVTFRMAQTHRRLNPRTNRWEDGDTSWYQITCWRDWSENLLTSLKLGEPVIVVGRLKIRDWRSSDGSVRSGAEIDAITVGHDGSRGVAKFERVRRVRPEPVAEDGELDDTFVRHAVEAVSDPWAISEADQSQPPSDPFSADASAGLDASEPGQQAA